MTAYLASVYRKVLDLCLVERWLVRRFIRDHLAPRLRVPRGRPGMVLDAGAGTAPFATVVAAAVPGVRQIFLDLGPRDRTTLVADCHRLPVADGALAAILSFQVIQSLDDPAVFIREVARSLAPGGLFLLTYPFLGAEMRGRDHWRYSESGMDRLLAQGGLEVLVHRRQGGLALTLTELLAWLPPRLLIRHDQPWQSGRRPTDVVRLAAALLLGLPFHALGFAAVALDRLFGRQPWYIGGIVLAGKPGNG